MTPISRRAFLAGAAGAGGLWPCAAAAARKRPLLGKLLPRWAPKREAECCTWAAPSLLSVLTLMPMSLWDSSSPPISTATCSTRFITSKGRQPLSSTMPSPWSSRMTSPTSSSSTRASASRTCRPSMAASSPPRTYCTASIASLP